MMMSANKEKASCPQPWRTQLIYNMSSVSTTMQFRLGRIYDDIFIFQGLATYRATISSFK